MADIFISYASEDRARVRPLAEALQGAGFSVWWDRALASGDDFGQVIRRELDAAKAVVVVWSAASASSPWVRDEASVARAAGRLLPVRIDPVDPPLGFGTVHTEDFSTWNGAANAPQIKILAEAVRARLEGREPKVDLLETSRKRVRVGRFVSMLATVGGLAALAGAGYFGYQAFLAPPALPPAQVAIDPLERLLGLVAEGKISGEQAVELAKLLQQQAFAELPPTPTAAAPPGEPGARTLSETAPVVPGVAAEAMDQAYADLDLGARETFQSAVAELLQDPDERVRTAVLTAASAPTREAGFDQMWALAKEGGASSGALWRACGALMLASGDPRAAVALERASTLNPQDTRVWRLLSVAYAKTKKPEDAAGAALVGQGLDRAAAGDTQSSGATLEAALPYVAGSEVKSAFVLGQLGDQAAARQDWTAASRHYESALRLREAGADKAGATMEATKLARALAERGEARRACRTLDRAEKLGADVAGLKQELCAAPATHQAASTAPAGENRGGQ
jgi:tetratricopeptide (TPR) repeat protein